MSPHMTGSDATVFLILVTAPAAFAVCGALGIVALLVRERVARITTRLATAGLILVHAMILAATGTDYWDYMFQGGRFVGLILVVHALVLAGYLRVRSRKRAGSSGLT